MAESRGAARRTPGARSDVLVIGGGAAGLAAAARLGAAGCSVRLLEARERAGGRIHTLSLPGMPLPVELGAEFIHGRPASTLGWLRRAGSVDVDTDGARFSLREGRLEPGEDLFAELRRGLAAARPRLRHRDLSFDALLEALPRRVLSRRARGFAQMLLEGFDAADPADASARAALAEWSGGAAADAPTSRPWGGYGVLVDALLAALDPRRVELRLGAVVHRIAWRRGAVRAEGACAGRAFAFEARAAIVTLPLGVLQQSLAVGDGLAGPPARPARGATAATTGDGLVRFDPLPRRLLAPLQRLGPGPVIKVVLAFREPFWEALDAGRYAQAAFFHAPGAHFPTFWTALPARAPLVVAWCAGPAAVRLRGLPREALLEAALGSFQSLWGRRVDARSLLQAGAVHDWAADPFARGAYSYVRVDGDRARRELARPLAATLWFAGEACEPGEDAGTVAGALQSGTAAASSLLRAA
ncbi:MAG: FAD-dependent oxidoreductase [Steroidobacteraceae bacterium]|nr:FAD-dependent oxidoreductase [Steroidobacteraceae bacterium]